MRVLLSVDLVFAWGFWARPYILSARQPSMNTPPPTTLVGALARGVANVLRARGRPVPEVYVKDGRYAVPIAAELGRCINAVYFRIKSGSVVVNADKSRVFQAPYVREANLTDPSQWFAVRDLGKAYAPGAEAEAAFVLDAECLGLGEEVLIAGAYSISRIGPVEGVVAVKSATTTPLEQCEDVDLSEVDTPCPYFPLGGGPLQEPWAEAEFLDWRDERTWTDERPSAGTVRYAVPLGIWARVAAGYPPCLTLGRRKGLKCGGRVYPHVG